MSIEQTINGCCFAYKIKFYFSIVGGLLLEIKFAVCRGNKIYINFVFFLSLFSVFTAHLAIFFSKHLSCS